MESQEFTITPQAFDRVAERLRELGKQLPRDEQAVLRAVVILAGEQLDQIAESEVSGFGFDTESLTLADASGFQRSFNTSFGAFRGSQAVPKRTGEQTDLTFRMVINGIF